MGVVLARAVGLVLVAPLLIVDRTDLRLERRYGDAVVGLVARLLAGEAKTRGGRGGRE